ncbi:MAG: magnesium transporter [Brevinematia bacterium]
MLKEIFRPEIIELIEEKQWRMLKEVISDWPPQDIASLIISLDEKEAFIIFRLLPKTTASEVFSELDSEKHESILSQLTNAQIKEIFLELSPDDRTELFEELPPEVTQKIINLLPPEDRKEALQLLGYPEDSVGRLMTPDYVSLKPGMTIEEAIKHIREKGIDAETINMVYIIDDKNKLIDDIPIRRLILSNPKNSIESIMDGKFISINVNEDQENAVKIMKRYRLNVLPVVDADGILLGIVTIDDMVEIMEEEDTEDFTKVSAISSENVGIEFITDLLKSPISKLYRSRVFWLVALLIMDLVTGGIIQSFEILIGKYVVLVSFLPVLVDTAGNAGSQSATLTIRALALGTVNPKDWIRLFLKEIFVSSLLGITMSVGISFMGFLRGGANVVKVVVTTMFVNVVIGSLIGIILPFIFVGLKKDPATASTPLITTLADIIGTGIYLTIAYFMLG